MRRSILLCLLLLAPGCSLWAVRGPDHSLPGGGDCTTSPAVPVVDAVLGAGLIGLGAAAFASHNKPDPFGVNALAQGTGAGLFTAGVVEAATAVVGVTKVSGCRAARTPAPSSTPVEPAPGLRLGVESGS